MGNEVRVFASATVANVGCGFDVLGFSLSEIGDDVVVRRSEGSSLVIQSITGDEGKLPTNPLENTVTISIAEYLDHLGLKDGFEIELKKKMPLSSGLGSSGASAVAGVYAVNHLLGSPLSPGELLPFAIRSEERISGAPLADNVAASLLGGFILVRSYDPVDIVELPAPADLVCTIAHPHIEINTREARKILKNNVPLEKAVQQWANVGGLIAGLFNEDYDLISRAMEDVIVEPVRSQLIPGYHEVKQAAIGSGALGAGISGSGPSIFALSRGQDTAKKAGEAMKEIYDKISIDCDILVSGINRSGPVILEEMS